MAKNQRLIGHCTYAEGVPFSGTLRIQRVDGNAIESIWREIPIVNGIIPDYVKLSPGIYNVQWKATSPVGFLPSEEWVVPESDDIKLTDLKSVFALNNVVKRKDNLIAGLQIEIARLRKELEILKTPPPPVTQEEIIELGIQSVILKEGLG